MKLINYIKTNRFYIEDIAIIVLLVIMIIALIPSVFSDSTFFRMTGAVCELCVLALTIWSIMNFVKELKK